jgi:hypothetical protein
VNIRFVAAELFHADRQTDMTKQIVAFRNFANAPNSEQFGKMKRMGKTAVGVLATLTAVTPGLKYTGLAAPLLYWINVAVLT